MVGFRPPTSLLRSWRQKPRHWQPLPAESFEKSFGSWPVELALSIDQGDLRVLHGTAFRFPSNPHLSQLLGGNCYVNRGGYKSENSDKKQSVLLVAFLIASALLVGWCVFLGSLKNGGRDAPGTSVCCWRIASLASRMAFPFLVVASLIPRGSRPSISDRDRKSSELFSNSLGGIIEEMKHKYHEGPEAGENSKKLATAVLQKPRAVVPPKAGTRELRQTSLASLQNGKLVRPLLPNQRYVFRASFLMRDEASSLERILKSVQRNINLEFSRIFAEAETATKSTTAL